MSTRVFALIAFLLASALSSSLARGAQQDLADLLVQRLREAGLDQQIQIEGSRLFRSDSVRLPPTDRARRDVYEDFLSGNLSGRGLLRHLAAADRRVARRLDRARFEDLRRRGILNDAEVREGRYLLLLAPAELDVEDQILRQRYRELLDGRCVIADLRRDRLELERRRRERRLRGLFDARTITRAEYSEALRLFRAPGQSLHRNERDLLGLYESLALGTMDAPTFRRQAQRFSGIRLSDAERRDRLRTLRQHDREGWITRQEYREAESLLGRPPRELSDRARALRRLYLDLGAQRQPKILEFRRSLHRLDTNREIPTRELQRAGKLRRLLRQGRLSEARHREGQRLLLTANARIPRKERGNRNLYEELADGKITPQAFLVRIGDRAPARPDRPGQAPAPTDPFRAVWSRVGQHQRTFDRLSDEDSNLLNRSQITLGRRLLRTHPRTLSGVDQRRRSVIVDLCEGRLKPADLDARLQQASRQPVPLPGRKPKNAPKKPRKRGDAPKNKTGSGAGLGNGGGSR